MILCFDDEVGFARASVLPPAAGAADLAPSLPDGELKLTLPPRLGAEVRLLRSLHRPTRNWSSWSWSRGRHGNSRTRRDADCPYLAYMRQDSAFVPGEVVSQKVIGRLLAELFDAVVTVDPPPAPGGDTRRGDPAGARRALVGGAADRPLRSHARPPADAGRPGRRSRAVGALAATFNGLRGRCAARRGTATPRSTSSCGRRDQGREVVLVDDVASSGHTLAAAARALLAAGAARVDAVVTHAVLAPQAGATLKAAGISEFWSTDTVPHESNALSVVPLIADALRPA